jgi:hypothetical protein
MSYYKKYLKYKNKYINLREIVENDKQPIHKEIMYDSGDKYIGSIIYSNKSIKSEEGNYKKDGFGKMIYPNKDVYKGLFKNNQMIKGKYTHKNEGFIENNEKHRQGKIIYKSGKTYEEMFKNNTLSTFILNLLVKNAIEPPF